MAFVVCSAGPPRPWDLGPLSHRVGIQQMRSIPAMRATGKKGDDLEPAATQPGKFKETIRNVYADERKEEKKRRPAFTAGDLMNAPVVTLNQNSTFEEAWTLIRIRRFRHVPIVDDEQNLVGIISDRDLLAEGKMVELLQDQKKRATPIGSLIQKEVLTATAETEVREIARVMMEQRIGAMPIVGADHKLIGILTRSDILRALVNNAPMDLWM